MTIEGRYSRNEGLFGAEGQAKIAATKVTIAGLGGLGSHVAQQLAYLGVRSFALIDFDVVTESSMNRLIGAFDADVSAATMKIDAAERMIHHISPSASVDRFDGRVADSGAEARIAWSDVVFGCLDRDIHRLELTEVCARNHKVCFDLASDTGGGESLWYGGRVILCAGSGCPVCLQLLDQEQMALDQMDQHERQADERIYGVARGALRGPGPSVVSVNGVVASLAVTEFMVHITGLRAPAAQLTYRADLGTVTKSLDQPAEGCYYCEGLWRAPLPRPQP
jgi:molybdopterin-synthase adenylyltransferase